MIDDKTRRINLKEINTSAPLDKIFIESTNIISEANTLSDNGTRSIPSKPDNLPEIINFDKAEIKKTYLDNLESRTILPQIDNSTGNIRFIVDTKQRYEILKKIGEGGAGDVELALDKDIYRLVAIKRLKKNLHNSMMLMRFVNEIRIVGHLEHPNIVPIHDVGIDKNEQYYFVMKYAPGETLQSIIAKLKNGNKEYHKKYSIGYRVSIFMEILKAIEFAHHNGIIHRDIKPANIMIGSHGEVMVMDWGISKRLKGNQSKGIFNKLLDEFEKEIKEADNQLPSEERMIKTENDFVIGTLAYMAPEQAQALNDKHDARTDVYGLTALFYEFLSLKSYLRPKSSLSGILNAISNEKPKFAMMVHNKFQASVPADLSHFLSKGLRKKPIDRFQSIKDMQILLNKINEGFAPIQCPFTFSKRATNSFIHLVNNRPMIGVMVFILFIMLSIGGIVLITNFIT